MDRRIRHRAVAAVARSSAIERALHRGEELDVLVIGGGVVGAGTALDAVTRGLSIGLVEARDFASGTSSRSSKLIHGGLRYLEMLDFGLVREALHERGLLLTRLAPHLVRPVPFLYPLTHRVLGARLRRRRARALRRHGDGRRQRRRPAAPPPPHAAPGAARSCPACSSDALIGALQYYDAQVDDARHTMELARTAAAYGAHVANRVAGRRLPAGGRAGHRRPGASTS